MYRIKKIGVFISHIYGNYQSLLCTGIVKKAKEYGYLTEIFTSNDGENLGEYSTGEFHILNIPQPDDYAGIIFASGTYLLPKLRQDIIEFLQTHFSCPVVDISQISSPFPQVILENHQPVRELTFHLGNTHHYKNICYLGSSVDQCSDALRKAAFLEGMKSLSLSVENRLYFCDHSYGEIRKTLKQILAVIPCLDAIVCYNDQIALTVVSLLKEWGFSVPGQVAVTGCDTLEFGQKIPPSLTSVTFPIDEVGETAAYLLFQLIHKKNIPPATTVFAHPFYGSSCGCRENEPSSSYFYTKKLYDRIVLLEQNLILDMHMSANLQGVNDIDDAMDLLAGFALSLPECREFYLCLYEDWDQLSSHIKKITFTSKEEDIPDTVLLKLAIKDGKRLPECTFTKRCILPDYLYDSRTSSYLYAPLFFGSKCFGYLALSFTGEKAGYPFSFISWLLNVNNMLKNLCDKKNLGLLVGRLEDIYARDELTGLLNHQSFVISSQPAFEKAIAEKQPVCAFMFDLSGLKSINDNFGHTEGNFAIQVLAHAIENSAGNEDICSRLSGDIFQTLGIGYTLKRAEQFIDNVHKYLDNYNKLHTKNYRILTNCGFCFRFPEKASEYDEMYEEAGLSLCQNKQNKKTV